MWQKSLDVGMTWRTLQKCMRSEKVKQERNSVHKYVVTLANQQEDVTQSSSEERRMKKTPVSCAGVYLFTPLQASCVSLRSSMLEGC